MFLRNQWYQAGWAHEIVQAPLARRIAGEPVVFWRTKAGRVVAFEDRCPHRLAPLSLGKVVGDSLQCGYHGVTFDANGACVRIPGQDDLPTGACVRSYRVVDKWNCIWLWLGQPERADETLIPDFHWMTEPGWAPITGRLHWQANYQLLVDNLLDLSHEAFLHLATIGNPAVADTPVETSVAGDQVRVTRFMRDVPPPPLFVKARGFTTNIDRLQDITFSPPCTIDIHVRATPAGTNDLSQALEWHVLNALTPETERSTHYFWGLPRHFSYGDADMDAMLEAQILRTFGEDQAMLEAQQRCLEERSLDTRTLATKPDAGPSRARGIVARKLRDEASGALAAS